MSPFTNNGTFGTPSGWGSDREWSSHYTWMPWQQNTPITGNPSRSDLHGTAEFHRESYTVSGFPPNTSSWLNNTFPDFSVSVYEGGTWPGNQHVDQARLESLFGVPENGAAGSKANCFSGMQVAVPLVEQDIPIPSRALPTFRSCPFPPSTRTQAPDPSRQSAFPLYHPVRATGQHGDHSNPINSLGAELEIFPFQSATTSVITGHMERHFFQTGLQPFATSNPVHFSIPIGPIPEHVSPTTMFQCSWISHGAQCSAWIRGDRKSVTNHLRDKHNFTCDIQVMACAWAGCTKRMRRRNIPRHIVGCHFAIKVICSECGMALSRADAKNKHRLLACTGIRKLAVGETTVED